MERYFEQLLTRHVLSNLLSMANDTFVTCPYIPLSVFFGKHHAPDLKFSIDCCSHCNICEPQNEGMVFKGNARGISNLFFILKLLYSSNLLLVMLDKEGMKNKTKYVVFRNHTLLEMLCM